MTGHAYISVVTAAGETVQVALTDLVTAAFRVAARRPDDAIDLIAHAVAQHCGVSLAALKGHSRKAHLVRARHLAIALARELTVFSMPEIGRRFGGRDHTTVLHAVRRIEALEAADETVRADLKLLRTAISGATA